ncbi:MAG: hypothetical protein JXR34_02010 [Bacteroidales bacterium]|nr:hypothetical protein [Bacteroidales bacterium]
MKRLLTLLVLVSMGLLAQATIHNVDNNPNRPSGYFDNLQLALNSASPGDTIYLYPSNTSYGNVTIKQKVHIFGKGYDGTTGNGSKIQSLTLDTNTSPSTNPSGSSFQGLTINQINCDKPNITNIVVVGNYISYYSSGISLYNNCSGWLIANNYFAGHINLYNNGNIVISNNVFYGGQTYPIYASTATSVIFTHNLVMNFNYMYDVYNAIISDNIFVCNGATNQTHMANNKFYNNISYRSALNPYSLPPAGNTGANNISNQDPLFESAPSNGQFNYTLDYHLKSNSPAKNAASDGTDIGPYGGSSPFVWGGVFTIPQITETNITNPVINVSTPVNVNVKGNKAGL